MAYSSNNQKNPFCSNIQVVASMDFGKFKPYNNFFLQHFAKLLKIFFFINCHYFYIKKSFDILIYKYIWAFGIDRCYRT